MEYRPLIVARSPGVAAGIPIGTLAGGVLALAAIGNLILPAFLGLAPGYDALLVALGAGSIGIVAAWTGAQERIALPTLVLCLVIAAAVLLLSGEGRLLLAPTDWYVRDAVLSDLGRHPWPFRYQTDTGLVALRAPLGMYLLPALAGGGGQAALDGALLACNTLMLSLLLALAAPLFPSGRSRWIALLTFLLFSGLDVVGTALMLLHGREAAVFHMENWAPGSQYTAPFTQISWAPQHAMAGWACALFYLLWQQRKLPIGILAAAIPLFAFWSPIAAAGAMPFALLAAWRGRRELRASDWAMGSIGVAIAMPALIYQHAGSGSVPAGWNPIEPGIYLLAVALEVVPLALPVLFQRPASRFGRDALILATVMLVLAPLVQVGIWKDFQMRITIVPLVIVAVALADLLLRRLAEGRARAWPLIVILAIGSLTVVSELVPKVTMRAAPPPRCSVVNAWIRQPVGVPLGPPLTYVTPADSLPRIMQTSRFALVDTRRDPENCWPRPWFVPAWTG